MQRSKLIRRRMPSLPLQASCPRCLRRGMAWPLCLLEQPHLKKYIGRVSFQRSPGVGTVATLPCKPAHALVQVAEDGTPWLRGFRCDGCGAVVSEATLCCRACGSRTAPVAEKLGASGTLYTWSVVHRSFPGAQIPGKNRHRFHPPMPWLSTRPSGTHDELPKLPGRHGD